MVVSPVRETAAFVQAWLEAEEMVSIHMKAIEWLSRDLSDCGGLSHEEIAEFWAGWHGNGFGSPAARS